MQRKIWLNVFLLALGVGLLVLTVWKTGVADLIELFDRVGWKIFLTALVYPLMCAWDAWGWMFLINGGSWNLTFPRVYWIRITGEAFNNLTPILDVGGEPIKVKLLQVWCDVPRGAAAVSIILAKTCLLISELPFVLGGTLLVWGAFQSFGPIEQTMLVGFGIGTGLLVWLLITQKRGFFSSVGGAARRMGLARAVSDERMERFRALDSELLKFFGEHRARFWTSNLLHFIGWLAGGVEIYLFMKLLGLPATLVSAVAIEALFQGLRFATFITPSGIGAQEGAMALLFTSLGLGGPAGLAISLLKRFRQLVWTAVGMAIWGAHSFSQKEALAPGAE